MVFTGPNEVETSHTDLQQSKLKDKAELSESINVIEDDSNVEHKEMENQVKNAEQETTKKSEETAVKTDTDTNADEQPKPKTNKRCHQCNKKLSLVMQSCGLCKCGGVYCSNHRFPNDHECQFDFKAERKEELTKNNPKVVKDKLNRI